MTISRTLRRLLMLTWVLFGLVPMTIVWRYLWPLLHSIGADETFSQFMSMYACAFGYMFILWLIQEIPVEVKR